MVWATLSPILEFKFSRCVEEGVVVSIIPLSGIHGVISFFPVVHRGRALCGRGLGEGFTGPWVGIHAQKSGHTNITKRVDSSAQNASFFQTSCGVGFSVPLGKQNPAERHTEHIAVHAGLRLRGTTSSRRPGRSDRSRRADLVLGHLGRLGVAAATAADARIPHSGRVHVHVGPLALHPLWEPKTIRANTFTPRITGNGGRVIHAGRYARRPCVCLTWAHGNDIIHACYCLSFRPSLTLRKRAEDRIIKKKKKCLKNRSRAREFSSFRDVKRSTDVINTSINMLN